MRALLLCALGCPAPEDKPTDTVLVDDTETTPSDTSSPESTPTGDTGTPSTDTYVTPIPDPCDSWTESTDTGLPTHQPVMDVATATATGPHLSAYLGYSLTIWDDVLYAGQPNYASYEPGGVHAFTLPDLALIGTWEGFGDEYVGHSLAVADVDGDGVVEVAVGSPFEDGTGSVSLLRGAPDGVETLLQVDDFVFHAGSFGSLVGYDVLFAALGSPPADMELIVSSNGLLWALDPEDQGSLTDLHALRTISGPPGFGGVTAALDLDRDGQLDLASSMSDGMGWFSGPWVGELTQDDRDGAWTLYPLGGSNLGNVLESLGDVTGDGGDDLGFSASTHGEDAERAGRAYLVEGGELPPDGPVDDLATRFHGEAVGDGMGWAMASGDLDGDGQLDLLVSASGVFPGEFPGKVLVYPGPVCPAIRTADDAALVLDGEAIHDMFGRTLATADLDDDGLDDVLVAAHGAPQEEGRGVIYLVPASSLAW